MGVDVGEEFGRGTRSVNGYDEASVEARGLEVWESSRNEYAGALFGVIGLKGMTVS